MAAESQAIRIGEPTKDALRVTKESRFGRQSSVGRCTEEALALIFVLSRPQSLFSLSIERVLVLSQYLPPLTVNLAVHFVTVYFQWNPAESSNLPFIVSELRCDLLSTVEIPERRIIPSDHSE